MSAVLGIDAAWTTKQPSGVALVEGTTTGWRLVSAASSYLGFYDLAPGGEAPTERPLETLPEPVRLLETAFRLCGRRIDLVAVDMPLAHGPITGRRVSDDAVSRAYGARSCGTHTPSSTRPGPISEHLTRHFDQAGYTLRTLSFTTPGLIEVYPHPALVELAQSTMRLPYKISRIRRYWPDRTPEQRKSSLLQEWKRIVDLLESQVAGVYAALPALSPDATLSEYKAYEDTLDAVVCAWVGACVLENRAGAYGDQNSAIWIPAGLS